MKVIIAGTRGITDMALLIAAIDRCGFANQITQVISGMCPNSPDMLGVAWAEENGVPVMEMPARWLDNDGIKIMRAGFIRNTAMAKYAGRSGGLIALWRDNSPGTRHMIRTARRWCSAAHIHVCEVA